MTSDTPVDSSLRAALGLVCTAVANVLREDGVSPEDIHIDIDSNLISDLGMDSVKFVDLTLALEDALGVDEFPMQDWAEREAQRRESRFSVRSLVAETMRLQHAGNGGIGSNRSLIPKR